MKGLVAPPVSKYSNIHAHIWIEQGRICLNQSFHNSHLLEGSELPVQVLTDHKNLEYFSTSQSLNECQIRWANFLADYNFQIIYRPGAQNKKADILSRQYDLVPLEGGVENQVLLKPELFISSITPDQEINNLIGEAIYEDDCLKEILHKLQNKNKVVDWELKEGLLWCQGKIFVPKDETIRNLILESRHNMLAAGHPGQARTLELVSRNYYWPSMKRFVNSYVPVGLLKPLQIPECPWEDIAYNMIVGLPVSEGFDAILTVIDQFSKMVHFIPTQSTVSAIDIANLFVTYVWKLHSLPKSTVSDRGPTFNAKFICHLYKRLDIKPTYSTAYHPQTDGQTERIQREAKIFIQEGKEEYKVEQILDSKWKVRSKARKLWYIVKWKGYNKGSNSWEPVDNMGNAKEAIEEFHKEHPKAVGA
ncbi:Retrotransposable element Tf2 protein [Rhizoctonia solani]|uniref:Retrotransposable element Tf2 protein n=1 Tax=Rhizoctonia solani TaxID=456999 RepID=A0A8H8SXN0_9AGAM|nr:Retrotransposable element Tf2 protein [Rhizoctonia solani]QRW21684.1 Retrotransposable element Tf2 protein [Rhizoctonia solani]